MKVICPECSSVFDVPVNLLGPKGRRVRCSACGHIWMQEPVEPPMPVPAAPAQEQGAFGGFRAFDEKMDIEPIPVSVHPGGDDDADDEDEETGPGFFSTVNWGYLGRMMLGFGLLVGLALGGVYGAARAGFTVPQLLPLYAFLKIEEAMPGYGLELEDVNASVSRENGESVVRLSGRIRNAGAHARDIPVLEISPIGADGTEGEGVRIKPEKESLKSGESVDFTAAIQGEPDQDGHFSIRFVP